MFPVKGRAMQASSLLEKHLEKLKKLCADPLWAEAVNLCEKLLTECVDANTLKLQTPSVSAPKTTARQQRKKSNPGSHISKNKSKERKRLSLLAALRKRR